MPQPKQTNKQKLKNLLKSIFYVYKQAPKAAIAYDILFLIITILEMVSISLWGKFIDQVAKLITETETFDLKTFYISDAFWFLGISTIVWIAIKIANNTNSYLNNLVSKSYYRNIRTKIIDKIANENLQEVEDAEFQRLLEFIQNYSINNIWWAYNNFSKLIRHTISLISAFTILLSTTGFSTIFLILIVIPEALAEFNGQKNIASYLDSSVQRVKEINYINAIILDIRNFIELKVGNLFPYFKNLFTKEGTKQDEGFNLKKMHSQIDNTLFSITDQILFRIYAIYLIAISINKKLSIGKFQATYSYAAKTYDSAYKVLHHIFILRKNNLYINKFYDFMNYEGFGDASQGKKRLKKGTPRIEFQDLDFQYDHEQVKALENINFVIEPGEKVAFIGGDGSGKSTLLKVFCGLYKITAGDYFTDEYSIRELARGELKKKISVMDEAFNMYYFTIRENITLGIDKDEINKSRYKEVKKAAQVESFMGKEDLDDNQLLGKFFAKGREISPGYWQRLAIARMLYKKADVYILDEPFTFIDQDSRRKILKNVINFIGDDKTLIYISQDKDDLDLFDKVFYLKRGKLINKSKN